jgi:hypothetical protein
MLFPCQTKCKSDNVLGKIIPKLKRAAGRTGRAHDLHLYDPNNYLPPNDQLDGLIFMIFNNPSMEAASSNFQTAVLTAAFCSGR